MSPDETHTVQVPLQLSHRVTGLAHTSWYQFSTRPGNVCGVGPVGEWSEPVRTHGAPTLTPPTPAVDSTDSSSAVVSWSAATAADIDSPITGYVVVYRTVDWREGDGVHREQWEYGEVPVHTHAMTCAVKGLRHDTQYRFAVRAVNAVGVGPVGDFSAPQWTKGPPTISMVRFILLAR